MPERFWLNKKVIVTGAGGFVGSHLTSFLENKGASVIGVTKHRYTYQHTRVVNTLDYKKLEELFSKNDIYVCFHLASESLVEKGQKAPFDTFQKTIISTLNVLEICRIHKVKRIIIASTSHVYGDTPLPFKEEDPPRPSRPYETSKTCTDLIAQSYADTFHLPVLIPRFVNIYGPGDLHFSRVIPKTIRSVLKEESPTMWGGDVRREYLYIDDVLTAYNLLARITDVKLEKNRIYNFGTGEAITVRELIQKIILLNGKKMKINKVPSTRVDELIEQKVSWTKARRVLGWKPSTPLRSGLKQTIDWYRGYLQ